VPFPQSDLVFIEDATANGNEHYCLFGKGRDKRQKILPQLKKTKNSGISRFLDSAPKAGFWKAEPCSGTFSKWHQLSEHT
jgi:hypothetical protein